MMDDASPPCNVYSMKKFLEKMDDDNTVLYRLKMALKVSKKIAFFGLPFCNGIIACRKCFQKCRFAISKSGQPGQNKSGYEYELPSQKHVLF